MTGNLNTMTCGEFEPLVQQYLEDDVDRQTRDRMDAHRLDCAACNTLIEDLHGIRARAAALGDIELVPTRDLWAGIASRIEAEVVPIPTPVNGVPAAQRPSVPAAGAGRGAGARQVARTHQLPRALRGWTMLAAASLLVAATAAITWTISTNRVPTPLATAADTGFALAMDGTRNVRNASGLTLDQTYDRELSALRHIVDARLPDLDSATVATLQKNIAIIDQAIAACKTALAQDPSSAFLLDRLTDAYNSKLRALRMVAVVPQRG